MKKRCLAIALCFLLLPALTGCVSDLLVEKESTGDTLPDVRPGPSAPVGDSQSDRRVSAVLYLPDAELTRLTAQDRTVSVEAGDSLEKAVVDALLAEINASDFRPGQSVSLAPVSNAVEVTRDLVTVNLGTSARALGSEALFALRMAITNTLTTLTDINYVNILINGRDPGLDVRMLLPTGVLSRYPSTDISAQLTQVSVQRSATDGELQKTVALYFPSEDGEMLLGEVRDVTFSSRDLALYAQVLLEELQIGPLQSGMRAIVPPQDYFERSPSLTVVNGTDRYMEIYLREETDDYLLLNGGTPRAASRLHLLYPHQLHPRAGGHRSLYRRRNRHLPDAGRREHLVLPHRPPDARDVCVLRRGHVHRILPAGRRDGPARPYSGPLPRTSAPSRARSCASSWIPRAIPRSPLRFPRASATRISWGCKSPRTRRWSTSPTPLPPHAQA